jgi:ribosome-binding protein aMBF1 (putative translation factor)
MSSPLGRVALLGIAQRQIRVCRSDIPSIRIHRKPLPTSIQTLGDLIHIKRYEKRLTRWQLAIKMGIATAAIRTWESNLTQPDAQQMEQLTRILGFSSKHFQKEIGDPPRPSLHLRESDLIPPC